MTATLSAPAPVWDTVDLVNRWTSTDSYGQCLDKRYRDVVLSVDARHMATGYQLREMRNALSIMATHRFKAAAVDLGNQIWTLTPRTVTRTSRYDESAAWVQALNDCLDAPNLHEVTARALELHARRLGIKITKEPKQ